MNYSCDGCPTSCSITVEKAGGELEVSGHGCYTGKVQAIEKFNEACSEDHSDDN